MRSIFAKVLLWTLGTFALSLVAYWGIRTVLMSRGPVPGDPIFRLIEMVEDDLARAYEEGGPDRLAERLRRLATYLPGEHFLTDANGRDLASGADRSALLRQATTHRGPPRFAGDRFVVLGPTHDDRYRFISVIHPWFVPPNILPYYGAIVLVIFLMGATLAAHLVRPLRHLRRVVVRFGRGDLSSRADSARKDEIGELARAFDEMAGRIQVLMTAERRLLQDVSHELRSPLARLDVAADLASTSADPAEFLVHIRRDVGRLSALVDELLRLTRAEGDPAAREHEEVALDLLLQEVASDCALEAEASGCRLNLTRGDPVTIQGAPELFAARSRTWCATPSGTRRRGPPSRSSWSGMARVPGSPSATSGPASRRSCWERSSSRSSGSRGTAAALMAAPGSAWPSRGASRSPPWQDRCPQRPSRALGHHRAGCVMGTHPESSKCAPRTTKTTEGRK